MAQEKASEETGEGDTTADEPGAAGRKAWKAAISANNAAKARGRKWGKSQRPKPGMLRKPPPGGAA